MNPVGGETPIGLANPRRNLNLNGNSGSNIDCNSINVGAGSVCSGRRKSLNYQPQLSLKPREGGGGDGGGEATAMQLSSTGRFSPHPNEIFLPQSARLTIPPLEKFDDALINGCLPPPSPAPNSDCLSSNLSHPHTHVHSHGHSQSQSQSKANQMQQLNLNHFQHQAHAHTHAHVYPLSSSNSASSICTSNSGSAKSQPCVMALTSGENINGSTLHKHNKYNNNQQQQQHQRVMSPNSKYRLERYRDPMSGQGKGMNQSSPSAPSSASSGRYFLPPAKVQCDAYSGYLGSTVHTPVKRYVPTPPLASELYTDLSLSTSMTSAASTSCVATSSLPVSSQYVNMPLPYNYRVKCCHLPNEETGHSKSAQTYNVSNNGSSSSSSSSCPCPSPSPASSGISVSFPAPASGICSPNISTGAVTTKSVGSCNKLRSTASNPDEAESIIVLQPAISQGQGQGQDSTGTCLHCNTTRRTTGVHQTTQTTGPISPVPVSMPHVPMKVTASNDLAKLKYQEQEMMMTTHSNSISLSPVTIAESSSQQQHQQQQHQQQQAKLLNDNGNQMSFQRQANQQQMYAAPQLLSSSPRLQQSQMQNLQQQQQQQQQSLQVLPQQQQQQQQQTYRYSCKKRISIYVRREIARFFGVETSSEAADFALWYGRHRRLAIRRFGPLNPISELEYNVPMPNDSRDMGGAGNGVGVGGGLGNQRNITEPNSCAPDRPDILPAQDTQNFDMSLHGACRWRKLNANNDFNAAEFVERKASVAHMLMTSISYLINIFNKRLSSHSSGYGYGNGNCISRRHRQWSRSFAPIHVHGRADLDHGERHQMDMDSECIADTLAALIEDEVFFDNPCEASLASSTNDEGVDLARQVNKQSSNQSANLGLGMGVGVDTGVGVYMAERHHNGWRTSALNGSGNGSSDLNLIGSHESHTQQANHINLSNSGQSQATIRTSNFTVSSTNRGTRITAQLLDGVLENSRRPQMRRIKYFSVNDLDDRTDHRPFFTYWINTVQIVVLFLSIVCYGIAPIGFGSEQKTGQVLVTSLSLQTVQHVEQRNLWIGPRNNDLVHMGAKFAACMRRDVKIMDVLTKTRRQERETACCIRNDDSGCVQSSQADCSIRGLYPTKSISTWKKWSPGESGPGGRISGSVCGLDPKFCDAPASIAPYEWPDDITKWPICRKTNSFSQRYRYKDHTAEHMVCEIIGHPCCTGLYGECRITTREYCDFVNGYFHEEASLCSQISCLNNVCGMFPFFSVEIPDQFYRLLTSLCMHAGVFHLAITLIFQHLFLADLERLIGTLRTAVVYIMSGLVGNLTSAVIAPHRPEVGPSASLCGVVSALIALLILMHWKHLHKPYVALFKLLLLCTILFGIGTLPYQLNFAGLLAGVACGAFLTISLVPFATFTKYGRKKKINLIWTCILFHLFIYATLIATFYIYPSEFSTFNFVDDMFGGSNGGNIYNSATNSNIGHHNGDVVSSTRRYSQTQKPQYYYHHHSEDIIRNSVAFTEGNSMTHMYPEAQRQKGPGRLIDKKNDSAKTPQINHKYIAHMNDTKFKGL
ncbi:hypothetical protein ACLKA6_016699 [Drosophila palustris]